MRGRKKEEEGGRRGKKEEEGGRRRKEGRCQQIILSPTSWKARIEIHSGNTKKSATPLARAILNITAARDAACKHSFARRPAAVPALPSEQGWGEGGRRK